MASRHNRRTMQKEKRKKKITSGEARGKWLCGVNALITTSWAWRRGGGPGIGPEGKGDSRIPPGEIDEANSKPGRAKAPGFRALRDELKNREKKMRGRKKKLY